MLLQVIYAFFATITFAVVFNVPRDELICNGISGAVGWLFYLTFYSISDSKVMASFIAAIVIAFTGELFARFHKKPVTMFIIPALIMLVPGAGSYYTMLSVLQKNYQKAVTYGIETGSMALAIAGGLVLVSSFVRIFKANKKAAYKAKNHN